MPAIQPASVLLMPQMAMKVGVKAAKAKFGSNVPISPIDIANTSGRPRSAIMRLFVIPAREDAYLVHRRFFFLRPPPAGRQARALTGEGGVGVAIDSIAKINRAWVGVRGLAES